MDPKGLGEAETSQFSESRPLFAPDERVGRAIGYMRREGVYEVFSVREGRLQTATTRDVLEVRNPQTTKLGSILHPAPKVSGSATLGAVASAMYEHRARAIPISAEAESLTVVSVPRVLSYLSRFSLPTHASRLMTPMPVSVAPGDSVLKARWTMVEMSIDHLPVVEGEEMVGMLTSSHLMYKLLPSARVPSRSAVPRSGIRKEVRFDYPVRKLMEEPALEVVPEEPASEVIRKILDRKSSYAMVSRWGELMGIITFRDLMKLVPSPKPAEARCYIVGLPKDPFEGGAARMKMERLTRSLAKAFPQIEETRAVIKATKTGRGRGRYEVNVTVYSPREMYSYSESGNDLPEIFDALAPRIRRVIASRASKVTKARGTSIRKDSG